MRVAYISDLHIGNHRIHGGPTVLGMNARCRETLEVVATAVSTLAAHHVDALVVLGDVFDDTRPLPQTLRAFVDATGSVSTLVLAGNHDRNSAVAGDHALGPLDVVDTIRVIEEPIAMIEEPIAMGGSCTIAMLPFRAEPVMDWFAEDLHRCIKMTPEPIAAISVHFGLHDSDLRARHVWAVDSHDAADVNDIARVMKSFGIKHLFAGNWHTAKEWHIGEQHLVQVGALVPTGWDNPGLDGYGGLVIHDTVTNEVVRHEIAGPRFVVVQSEGEVDKLGKRSERLYISWRVHPDDYERAMHVRANLPPNMTCDVVLERKYVEQRAVQAATAARSQDTLEDALTEYIKTYPFPDTVRPTEVERLARSFLKL